MKRPFEAMAGLIDDGYPVFLTGDLNQPSSLDYTEEAVGTREEITAPVPWPVSEELFELGFRDSYREIHPDPVAEPGTTHRSGERIDYVYAAGPSTTLDSKLVGEPGDPDVEIEAAPWTSDHRAVLSTFEVTPLAMPTLIAVDASLRTVGDEVTITHNAPGSDGGEIAIVPEGADPDEAVETLAAEGERGTARLDTSGWEPGAYEAVLTARTAPSSPASRSTSAPPAPGSSSPPTGRPTTAGSRSRSRGRGLPPTAGTGSGSTRRRRRTPSATAT
jgi:hypothetical protein